ncbi:hypothetical protein FAZ15_14690 [Sphingobacterium olei]|uniref:Uncharacterized protein n=1 Tax=Sphingobacterium olei TaxID=2571155 RepID=A0A4U0NZ69_9SPHI|nr:hypothetical protein [Sphingobacterium olei]TJZ60125.1 hypothetical protein FAZ15_14690 [Sphingobacterium olei]
MNTHKTSAMTSKPGLVIALILAYEDYLQLMEGPQAVMDPNDKPAEEDLQEEENDSSESPAEEAVPDTEDPNKAADDITE